MDTGIGATLREARNRRKLDLVEVEDEIKIRVRYLQAIENEEWDALPGGAYTRGFIRTYATYLGLDGERLAEDYRRSTAPPGGERPPRRVEPVPTASRRSARRVPGSVLVVAVTLGLAVLFVVIGLLGGDEDGGSDPSPQGGQGVGKTRTEEQRTAAPAPESGVEVSLAAKAEVWVCLLDAGEEELVDGQILAEGARVGPFRSRGFELALGNGSVTMQIDGEPAPVEDSSSPVGYAIDSEGRLTALEEGERPDCE